MLRRDFRHGRDLEWDYNHIYKVTLDYSGYANGFGGVRIPRVYNGGCMKSGSNDTCMKPVSSTVTNTAVATGTGNGITASATAQASVQVDAMPQGWSQCSKY